MTNWTVDRTGSWAVYRAVSGAVYETCTTVGEDVLNEDMYWDVREAVYMVMYWSVSRAVGETVNHAMRGESPHPSLADFLVSEGAETP